MHSWYKYCIDPDAFKGCSSIREFVGKLRKQSNEDAALVPYRETTRLSDYDDDGDFIGKLKAPRYFGAGGEALAETFFEVFGAEFNIANYRSLDDVDGDEEDTGFDAMAYTAKKKVMRGTMPKIVQPGHPVYVQIKTALNPTKEFKTNDGSRIMNFYGNAQGKARQIGQGHAARFVLFTTAKGLHYKLDNNTFNEIEVVNFDKLKKRCDNNPFFWNTLLAKLGLPEMPITGPLDPEWDCMQAELDELLEEDVDEFEEV